MLFDGQRLAAPDGGIQDLPVTDLWGDAPSNVWLVGSAGLILRWNGTSLVTVQPAMPGGAAFTAVAGLRSGEVFIGGPFSGLRWTGSQLVSLPALPANYRVQDLHSPDGLTLFALGNSSATGLRWGIFRWNGAGWDAVVLNSFGTGRNLHGQRAEELWFVAGGVQRVNGLATTPLFADGGIADAGVDAGLFRVPSGGFSGSPNMVFTTAASDAGPSRVYVAGDGVLEVLADGGWDRTLVYPSSMQNDVTWVGGPAAGPPYFALGATLVRKNASSLSLVANTYRLPSMNSTGAFQPTIAGPLHAVSDDVVWWFPPSSLATMTPRELNVLDGGSVALAVGPPITATHCYAPRECVVGNLFGQVGLFTGSTFLTHGAASGVVTKLVPSPAGSVYVLTESGGLGHWRDGGVVSVPLPPFISPGLRTVRDISVRPPDELWAAGIEPTVTQGGVFRLTPTGWQATGPLADAGWPFIPETLLVRSSSLAYVGGNGQFATWDGGVWNVQSLPSGFSMGFLTELDGQVYSRSNGQLFRLTDAGVFESFGPPRLPIATLEVSGSFLWMGFSSEAGVLRRPRP